MALNGIGTPWAADEKQNLHAVQVKLFDATVLCQVSGRCNRKSVPNRPREQPLTPLECRLPLIAGTCRSSSAFLIR
jgi:hypothetical protein